MNYYVSGENVNGRPCRGVVHVVKKGDTLYKISRVYDVKVADLIWMNPGCVSIIFRWVTKSVSR